MFWIIFQAWDLVGETYTVTRNPMRFSYFLPGHREGEASGGRAHKQNAGKNTTGGRAAGGSRAGRSPKGGILPDEPGKPWKHKTVGIIWEFPKMVSFPIYNDRLGEPTLQTLSTHIYKWLCECYMQGGPLQEQL